MNQAKAEQKQWLTWPFLLALAILIVNDHYLKPLFANALTGKLSDFAGIFVVAVLLFAWRPMHKVALTGLLALLFVVWKSPLATPLIDEYNHVMPLAFGIERVVDYSDCVALLVIPLAGWTRAPIVSERAQRYIKMPVLVLCALAIMATSKPRERAVSESFTIQQTGQKSHDKVNVEQIKQALTVFAQNSELTPCVIDTQVVSAMKANAFCFENEQFIATATVDKGLRTHIVIQSKKILTDSDKTDKEQLTIIQMRERLTRAFASIPDLELVFNVSHGG